MKALRYAALAAGLVVVVSGVGIYFSLNALVKKAIETVGPKLTGTTVTLDSVALFPFTGSGSLYGLAIGNPQGYAGDHSFKVRRLSVSVKPSSLLSDTIVVRRIDVEDPDILYVAAGSSNLSKIQKNIESSVPAGKSSSTGPSKKIFIGRFRVRGGKVRVNAAFLKTDSATMSLPDIELHDIGGKGGGATVQEAAGQIFGSLTKAITSLVQQPAMAIGKTVSQSLNKGLRGLFKK